MNTQEEMRTEIISKAVNDDAFRARLLENPKEAVQEALGITIPAAFTIVVHEESVMTAHLVLPSSSQLDGADLGLISGGGSHDDVPRPPIDPGIINNI